MKKALRFVFTLSIIFLLQMNVSAQEYILIGWNDLGMHCANKDFSKIAILPPFNNINAQLIKKVPGENPKIVTTGYEIEYSIPGNTYSVGKTNFWTYAQQLFNLPNPLPDNIGLTGKGLTGNLDTTENYFFARGIPVTPFPDSNLTKENPFQLIHLVARQSGSANILATTDVVIPISNDLNCLQSGCHVSEQSILDNHPVKPSDFNPTGPNLCASCHQDNALGTTGDPETMPLSEAIHHKHAGLGLPSTIETCYKCHPGPNTHCLRDVMSMQGMEPMICEDCHGTLEMVSHSISHDRRPWLDEPKCGDIACHGSLYAEEPGKLFRQSKGHSGLFCSACHGSPHAILPSREANDNLQNIRLQGYAGTLQECTTCHDQIPGNGSPHELITGIHSNDNSIPESYQLLQNYPNPFNPETKIGFELPKESNVSLRVFSAIGEEIATLVDGVRSAGRHEVLFDAAKLSSGLYYCRLEAGNFIQVKKMLLMK